MKNSLSRTEWGITFGIIFVVGSLILVSKVNAQRSATAIRADELVQEEILVSVSGTVKKPGEYKIRAGSTIGEVLKKAGTLPEADLSSISLQEIIEKPTALTVPELKEIKVYVSGAVQEAKEIVLPVRSRICDLKSKVIFTEETEKTFFRRRKLLKNGAKIEVPKKTVEVKSSL